MLKNPLSIWLKWIIRKHYFEFKYTNKKLKVGYLATANNCRFGSYNTLYPQVALNNVSLGNFTYIAEGSRLTNTTIGKFSSIGPEVLAGLGRHPSRDFVSTHPIFYSPNCQAQITFSSNSVFEEFSHITIGNDVWIGARSIILDGVAIGDGAIVGAGALVTKDVPSYAVVGGIPAKILRYRFQPEQIESLKKLKWWDQDIDWLRKNAPRFQNIHDLMLHDESNK